MEAHAMINLLPHDSRRSPLARRKVRFCLHLLLVGSTLASIVWALVGIGYRRAQMHCDPKVATVWVLGVTYGDSGVLERKALLSQGALGYGKRAFGNEVRLQSKFHGNRDGIEIWFDYESHLGQTLLQCQRVGETVFVDDLGQPYPGYLDLQGRYVGVYLPGYDHAAKQLFCALRWLPRGETTEQRRSRPMLFSIPLPAARRLLPSASTLPRGPICATRNGITVTVSRASLRAYNELKAPLHQRELTFTLKVQGGEVANANVDAPGKSVANGSLFTLSDPYGISLMPAAACLTPLRTLDGKRILHDATGTTWVAPVNSVGIGTDVLRIHLDVRADKDRAAAPIPFDLIVPAQTTASI